MKIIIIGGGFLGQLLHTVWPYARVFDWRPSRPTVQARQLGPMYLWEPLESIMEHRQFVVYTTVDGSRPNPDSILAYKQKVGKEQDNGDWLAQFQPVMNGYECTLPLDRVEYGQRVVSVDRHKRVLNMSSGVAEEYDLVISTIPLPAMMQLAGLPQAPAAPLMSQPIYLQHGPFPMPGGVTAGDMHVNYVSDPRTPVYRKTLRDGAMHIEALERLTGDAIRLVPGKIYENPNAAAYVSQLADFGVVCLGRYATWSPDELAHQTFKNALVLRNGLYA